MPSPSPEYVITLDSSDEDSADIEINDFQQETRDLLDHPQQETVTKALHNLECPICFDVINTATATSCGHVFCLECILQSVSSSTARGQTARHGVGLCPLCRKKVTFKDTIVLRMKPAHAPILPPDPEDLEPDDLAVHSQADKYDDRIKGE